MLDFFQVLNISPSPQRPRQDTHQLFIRGSTVLVMNIISITRHQWVTMHCTPPGEQKFSGSEFKQILPIGGIMFSIEYFWSSPNVLCDHSYAYWKNRIHNNLLFNVPQVCTGSI